MRRYSRTDRSDTYLENLFSVSAGDAAGGVDLDLTLRLPDHVALSEDDKVN